MSKLSLNVDIVGRRYPKMRNFLSESWIQSFSNATQSSEKLPLSFVAALRDGPFAVFEDLGIELKRLLHISQDYIYHNALQPGEEVLHETEVSLLEEKQIKLGEVYLLALRTKFFQQDKLLIESVMTVFVRR